MPFQPGLRPLDLAPRIGPVAGAVERDQVGIPVALEAGLDQPQRLVEKPQAGECVRGGRDDLDVLALARAEPLPIRLQLLGIAGLARDVLRDGVPAQLRRLRLVERLGALQLARLGILVSEIAPGIPTVGEVSAAQVRDYMVTSALALVTADRAS